MSFENKGGFVLSDIMNFIHSKGLQWNDNFPSEVASVYVSLVEEHGKLPDINLFLQKTSRIRTSFFKLNFGVRKKDFLEHLVKRLNRNYRHFRPKLKKEQNEIRQKSEEQINILKLISSIVGGDGLQDIKDDYNRVKNTLDEVIEKEDYDRLKLVKEMFSRLQNKIEKQKSIVIKVEAPKPVSCDFISIDEITSFGRVKSIVRQSVENIVPLKIPEETIKQSLAQIIGEKYTQRDWGGEKSDFFTTRLNIGGKRIPTAFLLKGSGTRGKLTIKKCGKNGDQILRLLEEPAELFIVQHVDEIDSAVTNLLKKLVSEKSAGKKKLFYCVIDGIDTARILLAYNKSP